MEIRDRYRDYITDGSRDGNSVACAAVFSTRLPDSESTFTAAILAIVKALEEDW